MEELNDTVRNHEIYGKHKTIPNRVDCNTHKETHASSDDPVATDARVNPYDPVTVLKVDMKYDMIPSYLLAAPVSRNSDWGYNTMPKDKWYYDMPLRYLFKD